MVLHYDHKMETTKIGVQDKMMGDNGRKNLVASLKNGSRGRRKLFEESREQLAVQDRGRNNRDSYEVFDMERKRSRHDTGEKGQRGNRRTGNNQSPNTTTSKSFSVKRYLYGTFMAPLFDR